MFYSEGRIFACNKETQAVVWEKDYLISEPCGVQEVDEGILLPLRICEDIKTINAAFEGGVCDKYGNFIAGHERCTADRSPAINLACNRAYKIEHFPKRRNETVIFGGVLYWGFGDPLIQGMTRLWYWADHLDTPYKIVFLNIPLYGGFKAYSILEAMGLTPDRYEIVTEPTQFNKIIVPDESMFYWAGFHPDAKKIYDLMVSRVIPGKDKKVYLSRTKFSKQDGVNEEYFEDFYRRRGFRIVYPEQLPLTEQISILAGAEEVVCTRGTLSLMTFFCKEHTRVTVLERAPGFRLWPLYMLPIQTRKLDAYFIDAAMNFLPAGYILQNTYFYGPTVYWKEYLDAQGIEYTPDEISWDLHVKPHLYEYLVRWVQTAATPQGFKNIKNTGIVDVINGIHQAFLNTSIDKKKFADRDDVAKLRKENADLKKNVQELEQVKEKYEQMCQMGQIVKQSLSDMGIPQTYEVIEKYLSGQKREQIKSVGNSKKEDQLEKEVRWWKKHVADMEDSLSWRITAPLRRFKAWLKRNPK